MRGASVSVVSPLALRLHSPSQVVFLTGFGYVYVDIGHQCGTVIITVAPEGKAGPTVTGSHR